MCEHNQQRVAVFVKLLQAAASLGSVEEAHCYGALFTAEGKTDGGRYRFSLTLEEGHG